MLPVLAIALASVTAGASVPADSGRFVWRELRTDRDSCSYAVWLPPGHASRPRWPGIVFLHGSGECGRDGVKPTWIGLGPALRAHPERWPFVVVMPQKPYEEHEWEEHEDLVIGCLRSAAREFGVDSTRVALVGMSQGAHGTWYIGARDSALWRALVPVSGYGRGRTIAPRVSALPVWAFHGLRDDLVNPEDTRQIIRWLRDAKRARGLDPETARMTLYPEANHDAWDAAFADPELPRWLVEQTRAR